MKRYLKEEKNTVIKSLVRSELFDKKKPRAAIKLISSEYNIPRSTIIGWYVYAKKKGLDTFMFDNKEDDSEKKIIPTSEYYKLINKIKYLYSIEKPLKEENEKLKYVIESQRQNNLKLIRKHEKDHTNIINHNRDLKSSNSDLNEKFISYERSVNSYYEKTVAIQKLLHETQGTIKTLESQLEEKNKTIHQLQKYIQEKEKVSS